MTTTTWLYHICSSISVVDTPGHTLGKFGAKKGNVGDYSREINLDTWWLASIAQHSKRNTRLFCCVRSYKTQVVLVGVYISWLCYHHWLCVYCRAVTVSLKYWTISHMRYDPYSSTIIIYWAWCLLTHTPIIFHSQCLHCLHFGLERH